MFTLVTGIIYPFFVTGVAQAVFPHQAGGSLINADGTPVLASSNGVPPSAVGSALIGQDFSNGPAAAATHFFWSRPSATGPVGYTAFNSEKLSGSSASNLAASNPAFLQGVTARINALNAADAAAGYVRPAQSLIPVDLITASASGLDPQISPAAAEYQLARVAKARGLSEEAVRQLVRQHTRARSFGLLGEPVVTVLTLNLDLAKLKSVR